MANLDMYKEITDSELLMLYHENNEDAKNILYERHGFIINVIINKYHKLYRTLNIDEQELFSEASVGFSDAINNYQEDKNATLPTFITLCIERRLYKLAKKYQTDKHKANVDAYSLEFTYDSMDRPLMEIISDDSKNDPLINLEDEEGYQELLLKIKETLSESEYEVFMLMKTGYNYMEISEILRKTPKQIDNTIQRIRKKVRILIEEMA